MNTPTDHLGKSDSKRPSVLITGGNGRLGQAISRFMRRQGLSVTTIVRRELRDAPHDDDGSGSTHIVVRDYLTADWPALMRDTDFLIHAAGSAHGKGTTTPEEEIAIANRIGLAARDADHVRKFVYLSSAKAVAEFGNLSDDSEPRPTTAYGKTKLACENELGALFAGVSDKLITLRLMPVYGDKSPFLSELAEWIVSKKPIPIGRRPVMRSLLGIDNLGHALVKILEAPVKSSESPKRNGKVSGTFLLADPLPINLRKLCEALGERHQIRVRFVSLPTFLPPAMRLIFTNLGMKETVRKMNGLTESFTCDPHPFFQAIDWYPEQGFFDRSAINPPGNEYIA